jgi:hypothetical protein
VIEIPTQRTRWETPRDAVYEVKYVSHSQCLVVRARMQEMFAAHLHSNGAITERAAELLINELFQSSTRPAGSTHPI